MINFVIVSHSHKLAEGVLELARQMSDEHIKIALAAGVDDPDNPIGTDAVKILQAIEEVFTPDGVILFVDLGSAILSAETALELLEPEMAEKVVICSAPLVEGMISAVVSASSCANLETVLSEANQALNVKKAQLMVEESDENIIQSAVQIPQDFLITEWVVKNENGLHARPAALLAKNLANLEAQLILEKNGQKIDPKSLNQLIQLQVRKNDKIKLYATGAEAQQAIQIFEQLAKDNFGESVSADNLVITGQTVVVEQLEGQAYIWHNEPVLVEQTNITDVSAEQQRLTIALEQVKARLQALTEQMIQRGKENLADIFSAHLLMLDDDEFSEAIYERIHQQKCSAEWGVSQQMETLRKQYLGLDDPYLQARELDIRDLSQQIMACLMQKGLSLPQFTKPSILFVNELTPSQLVQLDLKNVLAICEQEGNTLSHTALLAKGLNIPMMVKVGHGFNQVHHQQQVKIDLSQGKILLI